jgi:hypothetical protein
MSAEFLKALTANRLSEGDVVFWAGGQWVEQFAEAELFTEEAPAEDAAADEVVVEEAASEDAPADAVEVEEAPVEAEESAADEASDSDA